MTPETKETLDDYENILKGLDATIANMAISKVPCELHSFYENASSEYVTEKIVSKRLTSLILTGIHIELRAMERYTNNMRDSSQINPEQADEILTRIAEVRKSM